MIRIDKLIESHSELLGNISSLNPAFIKEVLLAIKEEFTPDEEYVIHIFVDGLNELQNNYLFLISEIKGITYSKERNIQKYISRSVREGVLSNEIGVILKESIKILYGNENTSNEAMARLTISKRIAHSEIKYLERENLNRLVDEAILSKDMEMLVKLSEFLIQYM